VGMQLESPGCWGGGVYGGKPAAKRRELPLHWGKSLGLGKKPGLSAGEGVSNRGRKKREMIFLMGGRGIATVRTRMTTECIQIGNGGGVRGPGGEVMCGTLCQRLKAWRSQYPCPRKPKKKARGGKKPPADGKIRGGLFIQICEYVVGRGVIGVSNAFLTVSLNAKGKDRTP